MVFSQMIPTFYSGLCSIKTDCKHWTEDLSSTVGFYCRLIPLLLSDFQNMLNGSMTDLSTFYLFKLLLGVENSNYGTYFQKENQHIYKVIILSLVILITAENMASQLSTCQQEQNLSCFFLVQQLISKLFFLLHAFVGGSFIHFVKSFFKLWRSFFSNFWAEVKSISTQSYCIMKCVMRSRPQSLNKAVTLFKQVHTVHILCITGTNEINKARQNFRL